MRTIADLGCLEDMPDDEYTPAVRAKYLETLDLQTALGYRKTLQAAAEAMKPQDRQASTHPANPAPEPARAAVSPPTKGEKIYALRLEFHLTMDQANALKKFLADNHIDYTKI